MNHGITDKAEATRPRHLDIASSGKLDSKKFRFPRNENRSNAIYRNLLSHDCPHDPVVSLKINFFKETFPTESYRFLISRHH